MLTTPVFCSQALSDERQYVLEAKRQVDTIKAALLSNTPEPAEAVKGD